MRRDGRRLSKRDFANGPSYIGDLTTHAMMHEEEGYYVVATLHDGPLNRLLPELYEPTLEGFGPIRFKLRGFERVEWRDGARGVVQEWICELP